MSPGPESMRANELGSRGRVCFEPGKMDIKGLLRRPKIPSNSARSTFALNRHLNHHACKTSQLIVFYRKLILYFFS